MKRLATLLLAGATIVAAQTATKTQTQEMEKLAAQLQEKLTVALNKAGEDAERAQKAAMEYQVAGPDHQPAQSPLLTELSSLSPPVSL